MQLHLNYLPYGPVFHVAINLKENKVYMCFEFSLENYSYFLLDNLDKKEVIITAFKSLYFCLDFGSGVDDKHFLNYIRSWFKEISEQFELEYKETLNEESEEEIDG